MQEHEKELWAEFKHSVTIQWAPTTLCARPCGKGADPRMASEIIYSGSVFKLWRGRWGGTLNSSQPFPAFGNFTPTSTLTEFLAVETSSLWGFPRAHPNSWSSVLPFLVAICVCMRSCFSCVWLFATLWTVAHQAPLSMGFSRQEYWSGLPCPSPGDLPGPGIKPVSLMCAALAGEFFTTNATREAPL